jgi:hypothetical protein
MIKEIGRALEKNNQESDKPQHPAHRLGLYHPVVAGSRSIGRTKGPGVIVCGECAAFPSRFFPVLRFHLGTGRSVCPASAGKQAIQFERWPFSSLEFPFRFCYRYACTGLVRPAPADRQGRRNLEERRACSASPLPPSNFYPRSPGVRTPSAAMGHALMVLCKADKTSRPPAIERLYFFHLEPFSVRTPARGFRRLETGQAWL